MEDFSFIFFGQELIGPGWKISFLTGVVIYTWLEEPVVVENVGRGIVEQVEEGPRPNLKNTMKKKEIGVPVI